MTTRLFKNTLRNTAVAFFLFAGSLTTQAQTNYAISLDGVDDQIDFGNAAALNVSTNVKAMECWVRFTSFATGFKEIISKSVVNSGMEILVNSTSLSYYLMRDVNNVRYINYPTSNLSLNTWYHIVGTWDGSDYNSARLYVNGISVGTMAGVGTLTAGIGNPGTLKVGQWSDPGDDRSLNAQVDEVRIWSVNRIQSDIKKQMYAVLPSNTPNLVAYYRMNEVFGTGVNSSASTTGVAGTLSGGTRVSSPVQYGTNGIDLDGADDYVFAPANAAYNFTTANVGTIEFMVRPRVLTATNGIMVGLRDENTATKVSIHMSSTQVGIWNGTNVEWFNNVFNTGQWYHLAFVSNGTTTALYINGALAYTYAIPFGTTANMPLVMGKVPSGTTESFTGALDEVRIWNGTRTATQINDFKGVTLTGTESGLVGLYSFDQGIANGTNSGILRVIDRSATNNTATVANLALTGTTSNFVSSVITVILPVTLTSFNVTKSNQLAVVNWQTATESNSKTFVVERSANGTDFTAIGSVAAAGNSTELRSYSFTDALPLAGKNYYRLKSVDIDAAFTYSAARLLDFSLASKLSWNSADGKTIDFRWTGNTPVNYQISDISGRLIEKGIIQGGTKQLTDLKPGMYVISLENSGVPAVPFIVR